MPEAAPHPKLHHIAARPVFLVMGLQFRVQGLGLRIQVSGSGSGFRVSGVGFGLRFWVEVPGIGFEFRFGD